MNHRVSQIPEAAENDGVRDPAACAPEHTGEDERAAVSVPSPVPATISTATADHLLEVRELIAPNELSGRDAELDELAVLD